MNDTPKKLNSLDDLRSLLPGDDTPAGTDHGAKPEHDGRGKSVHVSLDMKGRKGKTVTLVIGLRHNPDMMNRIASILKQYCGAGGTVKDGAIEIQGDNRERVSEKLRSMNYVVK